MATGVHYCTREVYPRRVLEQYNIIAVQQIVLHLKYLKETGLKSKFMDSAQKGCHLPKFGAQLFKVPDLIHNSDHHNHHHACGICNNRKANKGVDKHQIQFPHKVYIPFTD